LFGDFVRSKNRPAQINEVLLNIICHNLRQISSPSSRLGLIRTSARCLGTAS